MFRKIVFAATGLVSVLAVTALVQHLHWQAGIQKLMSQSSSRAALRLSQKYAPNLQSCPQASQLGRNQKAIISALFTLEKFSASWPERIAENQAVRLAKLFNFAPPDWSYGPGQIRLSRATKTLNETPPAEVATLLLSTCSSLPVAQALLSEFSPSLNGTREQLLSRANILDTARAYNGAIGRHSGEAALSSAIYQALTYDLVIANYYRLNARALAE